MYVICTIKQYLAVTMSHGAGRVRAGNKPSRSLQLYNHREGPYYLHMKLIANSIIIRDRRLFHDN